MARRMSDADTLAAVRQLRAGLAAIGPLTGRQQDPFTVGAGLMREMDADYAGRLAKWERDAPKREAAERAMERAYAQRDAELRLAPGRRFPVLAALWADPPQPWRVW